MSATIVYGGVPPSTFIEAEPSLNPLHVASVTSIDVMISGSGSPTSKVVDI